jgi:hypothetical protein
MSIFYSKNLTKANRGVSENILRAYWVNSPLSRAPNYPTTNFSNFLKYYDDRYPTWIESIGDTGASVGIDSVKKSMERLAKNGWTYYPSPSKFNEQIAKDNEGYVANALTDAGVTIAKDASNFFSGAFKVVLIIAAIGFGLAVYTKNGGKFTK